MLEFLGYALVFLAYALMFLSQTNIVLADEQKVTELKSEYLFS